MANSKNTGKTGAPQRSASKATDLKRPATANTNAGGSGRSDANAGESPNMEKMAITPRGLRLLLVGLLVMVSGYILMIGGGSKDPAVFNYAMFDFRRLVAAPLMILLGVVIEIISIVKVFKK